MEGKTSLCLLLSLSDAIASHPHQTIQFKEGSGKGLEVVAAAFGGDISTYQPEPILESQRLQHKSEEATLQKVPQEQLQEGVGFA